MTDTNGGGSVISALICAFAQLPFSSIVRSHKLAYSFLSCRADLREFPGRCKAASAGGVLWRITAQKSGGPHCALISDVEPTCFLSTGKALLTQAGRLIEPSPTIPVFIGSKLGNLFRRRKHLVLATQVRRADLDYLAKLVGEGALDLVIAATFAIL